MSLLLGASRITRKTISDKYFADYRIIWQDYEEGHEDLSTYL